MLNKLFNVNMRNGKNLLLIGYCVMNEKKTVDTGMPTVVTILCIN